MKPEDAQQSGCAGKGKFPSQQQAAERAQRMRQRHCGAWHIGGKSRPVSAEHVRRFKRLRAALRDGGA